MSCPVTGGQFNLKGDPEVTGLSRLQLFRFAEVVFFPCRAAAFAADESRLGNEFFQLLEVVLYVVLVPLAQWFIFLGHEAAPLVPSVNAWFDYITMVSRISSMARSVTGNHKGR